MIAKKAKQTANLTKDKLSKGFCKGLYRKSSNLNLEISRKVANLVIEFALLHNVKVIVLENMAGWKALAGKRGTLLKQKFHLWCHRQILLLIKERWLATFASRIGKRRFRLGIEASDHSPD